MSPPQSHRRGRPGSGSGSGTALTALRHLRSVHVAMAVVVVIQVPALIALATLVPHGLGLLAVPLTAGLSYALLIAAASPFSLQPRSRAHLYLGIWPALAWWAACATFLLLSPLALLVSRLARLPAAASLGVVGILSAVAGVRAVWRRPRVYRVTLRFPDLPPAFDGYRIAQISDIHCGPFAPDQRVRSWVKQVNALGADLTAVTGDLITSGSTYIPTVAKALGELRAKDGVFAIMGNHDYFGAGDVLARALQDAGLHLLRNAATKIFRGAATLLITGVDDTWTRRTNLVQALVDRPADSFVVLLAHDPDVFVEAASMDVPLTLSGHTHGGQLAIPFLSRHLNLARFIARFTVGVYRQGRSVLYVNRGIGTTGPPIRIGARAEITLLTLRR